MVRTAIPFLVVLLVASAEVAAEQPAQPSAAEGSAREPALPEVSTATALYQLPKVGKPRKRIGGGRRGVGDGAPSIAALVPDHVGHTVAASPVLYWYLSDRAEGRVHFELTLIHEESIEPLIEAQIDRPSEPGVQSVRLADHGVELEVGREYQWFVALVTNPEHRSEDIVSSGWIERLPEPEGLGAALAGAAAEQRLALLGEHGLWYDVLRESRELVKSDPSEPRHRQRLAALLEQVGLPKEAATPSR